MSCCWGPTWQGKYGSYSHLGILPYPTRNGNIGDLNLPSSMILRDSLLYHSISKNAHIIYCTSVWAADIVYNFFFNIKLIVRWETNCRSQDSLKSLSWTFNAKSKNLLISTIRRQLPLLLPFDVWRTNNTGMWPEVYSVVSEHPTVQIASRSSHSCPSLSTMYPSSIKASRV